MRLDLISSHSRCKPPECRPRPGSPEWVRLRRSGRTPPRSGCQGHSAGCPSLLPDLHSSCNRRWRCSLGCHPRPPTDPGTSVMNCTGLRGVPDTSSGRLETREVCTVAPTSEVVVSSCWALALTTTVSFTWPSCTVILRSVVEAVCTVTGLLELLKARSPFRRHRVPSGGQVGNGIEACIGGLDRNRQAGVHVASRDGSSRQRGGGRWI